MEEGRLQLFVAINCVYKFTYAELHEKTTRAITTGFLCKLIAVISYRNHATLTDNDVRFVDRKGNRHVSAHIFERVYRNDGTEHWLTKVYLPWTNGQVERMNRTIREATVKGYHYGSHRQIREQLQKFINACNCAKRLKTLRGRTPWEEIINWCKNEPDRYIMKPVLNNMKQKYWHLFCYNAS